MEASEQRNPLEQFVENAHKRLERIDVVLAELRQDGNDQERVGELKSLFHNLAGTGGAYGFYDVSRQSRKGEVLCTDLMRAGRMFDENDQTTLRELVERLKRSLQSEQTVAMEAMAELMGTTTEVPSLSVAVLEWSDEPRNRWVNEVRNAGWPAKGVSTQNEFFAEFQNAPDAVIASADELSRDGFQFLKKLHLLPGGKNTVVILIGTLSNFADKVAAIRLGAHAYFEHQTEHQVVLDRLQELLQKRTPRAASVLIVDDDPEQVTFLRAVLQPAGYQVHSCKDPRLFEQELALAKPDLILLDLLMPKIQGTDLMRYIRQSEDYRSVPVIILSGVSDPDLRAEATMAGGDLQLQKPVSAEVLLRSVAGCLENASRRATVNAIEVVIK